MILSEEQIKYIVLNKHSDYKQNSEYECDLNMLVNGDRHKIVEFLIKLSNLETHKQKELREKYSKSTKGTVANLVRPFQNIFNALGGSRNYSFKSRNGQKTYEKQLIEKFKESPMSGGTHFFMSEIWGKRVIDSPRSCILIEITEDGKYSYPIFVSQKFITNWKFKNHLNYEYIVFDEGECEIDKKKINIFRVIDDSFDYTVLVNEKQEVSIIEINNPIQVIKNEQITKLKTIKNIWGRVNAIQMTTKLSTDMANKISILDPVIEDLQERLLDGSIKRLFKFLHGYPYFAEFNLNICPVCHGRKSASGQVCPACNGTGLRKKDVSDKVVLDIPEDKDEVLIKPSEVAAYISPAIDTWVQMNNDLKENYENLMFTLWGATIVADSKNQYSTLGARILDLKPINDVLKQYSTIAQKIDSQICDFLGQFYFGEKFEESHILYGNFYLNATPDQILETYTKLKQNNVPSQILDYTLISYYNTIYSKEPSKLQVALKDLQYEPYFHNTIDEVQGFVISENIKDRKKYYQLYRNTIDDFIFLKFDSVDSFNQALDEFISNQNNVIN